MFRQISDFTAEWKQESDSTIRLLEALSDESLTTLIGEGRRNLGFLAWHLTMAMGTMLGQVGLAPDVPPRGTPAPTRASEIVDAYRTGSESIFREVQKLDEESLPEVISFYGYQMPRGLILEILIRHQAHHRGQMTVLMRQCGLRVPGMYGPSSEEMAERGMEILP